LTDRIWIKTLNVIMKKSLLASLFVGETN